MYFSQLDAVARNIDAQAPTAPGVMSVLCGHLSGNHAKLKQLDTESGELVDTVADRSHAGVRDGASLCAAVLGHAALYRQSTKASGGVMARYREQGVSTRLLADEVTATAGNQNRPLSALQVLHAHSWRNAHAIPPEQWQQRYTLFSPTDGSPAFSGDFDAWLDYGEIVVNLFCRRWWCATTRDCTRFFCRD